MSLRLRGMAELDPLSVPLPHGTEVTTRVDRLLGDRRVPSGSVGRVVGQHETRYDVQVVGVGIVAFSREELLPRKQGQLRYALRRAADWNLLRDCVILSATVGSQAWGLADERSDTDVRGAFALPFAWQGGLAELPQDLVSSDGSTTFWELEKLVRQGLRADPNTLELLFVDTVQPHDLLGQWLLDAREAFVSQQIYGAFGRYALSQLKKLQQSARLAQHRALVLEWLHHEPTLGLDTVATRLAETTEIEAPSRQDAIERARDYIKQLYRSMYDQGLIARNELSALAELAHSPHAEELELPRELRPKNAYNLLRLVVCAIDWLETGMPRLRVTGRLRDELLAIKRAQVPLDDVLRRAEEHIPQLEEARRKSPLPTEPDVKRADELLRRARHECARRWHAGEPGPLGRDAPPLPGVVMEDE
jgi:hypothetical protein